tara:strand:- start:263 stop:541 length:279 start_codon:yes stop_codon:yes gene_type:complete
MRVSTLHRFPNLVADIVEGEGIRGAIDLIAVDIDVVEIHCGGLPILAQRLMSPTGMRYPFREIQGVSWNNNPIAEKLALLCLFLFTHLELLL